MLYIVLFLHQTTTAIESGFCKTGCISYYSYIKPQLRDGYRIHQQGCISYYSYIKPQHWKNQSFGSSGCISYYSYIKPQQILISKRITLSCISYYSYIKPQQEIETLTDGTSCISYYSYIKPQPAIGAGAGLLVVYRTIPTSNHNVLLNWYTKHFVVYRTIPTSNHNVLLLVAGGVVLYIVLFLHQTTTACTASRKRRSCISYYSYIKPQQRFQSFISSLSCISYYSYIKPQRTADELDINSVVYRTIPTSNHNWYKSQLTKRELYIVLFLHQTTTQSTGFNLSVCCISYYSYIKPQRRSSTIVKAYCCISYYSYIKPQQYPYEIAEP